MGRKRKYQKVTGCWVYGVLTPDYQNVYFGFGSGECSDRWQPNSYKTTSLQPFIEQYGWDNLIHIVIQDGLTKEQAIKIEDALIKQGTTDGWCINKQRSGGNRKQEWNKENPNYNKQYYIDHKEQMLDKMKEWRKEHKEELRGINRRYYETHKNKSQIQ